MICDLVIIRIGSQVDNLGCCPVAALCVILVLVENFDDFTEHLFDRSFAVFTAPLGNLLNVLWLNRVSSFLSIVGPCCQEVIVVGVFMSDVCRDSELHFSAQRQIARMANAESEVLAAARAIACIHLHLESVTFR